LSAAAAPSIQLLDWNGFEQSRAALGSVVREEPIDLVIGLARGGLPLAVCLSHDLGCRPLGTVLVTKTHSENAFAVWDRGQVAVSEILVPKVRPGTVTPIEPHTYRARASPAAMASSGTHPHSSQRWITPRGAGSSPLLKTAHPRQTRRTQVRRASYS
jgi:hypothetical protein